MIGDIGIKDGLIVLLLVIIGLMYFNSTTNDKIIATGSSYQQLEKNVVRAETEVVDKVELIETSKSISKRVNKSDVTFQGKIKGVVKGNLSGNKSDNTKVVTELKREKKDLYWKYELDGIDLRFPIGTAIYNPKGSPANRWKSIAYALKFDTSIIQQKKYDGTYETFIETWATHKNLKEKHGGGGRYPIEISAAKFQVVESKELVWSWYNPTMSLGGAALGLKSSATAIKLNLINYGYKKQLPVYQFISPTILFTDGKVNGALELVSANIGEYASLIKDLHIGVGITIPDYKPTLMLTTVF